MFPRLKFRVQNFLLTLVNVWGVNRSLLPKGHEIHSTRKLKHCSCVFFRVRVSGSEVNKRISFSKQLPQVLPLKVSGLLSLSPLSLWLLLQETMGSPSDCQASPVIPNESRAPLNTAVIQFPQGSGTTRHRLMWAGWECWAGDFCWIYTYVRFQGLKLCSPSQRSQLRQKGPSVAPVFA